MPFMGDSGVVLNVFQGGEEVTMKALDPRGEDSWSQPMAAPVPEARWPKFEEIPEPRMVALCFGIGRGTKLYQGYLDGHPQMYMVPGYPLMYFYPHWQQWRRERGDRWSWPAIIDLFCEKHASVIDSRRIPGHDGLRSLGESRDGHLAIDEKLFRRFLGHLLTGKPVTSRTFLLAVHYAHAFCNGQDLLEKKALLYHIHLPHYVERYLLTDFPELLVLAMIRDPRANYDGGYRNSHQAVDRDKLNATDATLYRRRTFRLVLEAMLEGLEHLRRLPPGRVMAVRMEDFHSLRSQVMAATARFMGIDDHPCFETLTFGGFAWWNAGIYKRRPTKGFNPDVLSQDWKNSLGFLQWFVFEGLFFRHFRDYGYICYRYRHDNQVERLLLCLFLFLPFGDERRDFLERLSWRGLKAYWRQSMDEADGVVPFKDYGFNAYYRHKWTHADLRLWRPRWSVTGLKMARERLRNRPGTVSRLLLAGARWFHLFDRWFRYGGSVLFSLGDYGRRVALTLRACHRHLFDRSHRPPLIQKHRESGPRRNPVHRSSKEE